MVEPSSPSVGAQSKNVRKVTDISFDLSGPSLTQQQLIERQHILRYVNLFAAVFFIGIPIFMALFLISLVGSLAAILLPFIIVTVLFLAVWSAVLGKIFAKLVPKIFARFASINGFDYQPLQSGPTTNDLGVIFQPGSRKKITDEVVFRYRDRPARFYQYECTIGSGNSARQIKYSVLEVNLPRPVIHTLLDSRMTGQRNFNEASIPIPFASNQRLELEGDFNTYFDLYAPVQYGRQVLEILTPDTMHSLIDVSPVCDVELVGDRMYLYFPTQILTLDALQLAFSTLDKLSDDLETKILKLPATGQIDMTSSTQAADAIAATTRIKTSIWKQGGVIGVLFVLIMWVSYFLLATGLLTISRTDIFILWGAMWLVLLVIVLIRAIRQYVSGRALKERYAKRHQ